MTADQHLLLVLGEEGSEIAQDVSKSLRFGLDDVNVLNPTGPNNRERLVAELNDLMGVVEMLVDRGILPASWEQERLKSEKKAKVKKFMRYAYDKGEIDGLIAYFLQ